MAESLGSAQADVLINVDKALSSLDRLEARLNAMDSAGQGGLGAFDNSLKAQTSNLEQAADRIEQRYKAAGTAMAAVGGAGVAFFGLSINAAANYEQSLSGVSAALGGVGTASGITEEQFAALDEEALRIGSSTSKSATEAAMAMELLGKAGISVEQILDGGAQAAVNLSEATGESLAQSAQTTAAAMSLFSDQGYSAAQITDMLTTGMNNSRATMSEFQTGLGNLAPVIAATGQGLDESAALIAYFNSQGIGAAEVGTSLTSAFNAMINPTAEASAKMNELGINAFDAQGNFVGFPALFDQVAAATANMTEEQAAAAMELIFGADAADVMALAAKNGGDGVRELTGAMNEEGSAAASAAERMDNFKGSMEQLKGAVETLMILIGREFLPILREIVDVVTGVVNALVAAPEPIRRLAAIIGLAASGFLALTGAAILVAPTVLRAADAFRNISKAIRVASIAMRAFLLANPWILAAAAAIAILALAYKTNFLGIRDVIDGVIDKVKQIIDVFRMLGAADAMSGLIAAMGGAKSAMSTMGDIEEWFNRLGRAIEIVTGIDITKWLTMLGKNLDRAVNAIKKFTKGFTGMGRALLKGDWRKALQQFQKMLAGLGDFLATPAKAIGDFLKGIKTGFEPLDNVINGAGRIFTNFGRLIQELFQGDLSGAFAVAKRLFDSFIDQIGNVGRLAGAGLGLLGDAIGAAFDALGNVDWGAVVAGAAGLADRAIENMGELASKVWDWVSGAAADVPWSDIIAGAKDLALDAIEAFGTLADKVATWVTAAATGVPWTDLIAGAADLASKAVRKFGSLAAKVAGWIAAAATGVPWVDIIAGAADLAEQAVRKFGSLYVKVYSWIISAAIGLPWADLIAGAADLASKAVAKFGELAGRVAAWIGGAAAGLPWADLIAGAADLAGRAITKFGELGAKVIEWVRGAATGLPWANIIAGAADLAGQAIRKFGSLADKVATWVRNAATGLPWSEIVSGAQDLAARALEKFGALGELVQAWVDNAAPSWDTIIGSLDTIKSIGGRVVGALMDGFSAAIPGMEALAGTVVTIIDTAIDIGTTLYAKGEAILGALVDGLNAGMEGLGTVVTGVAEVISIIGDAADQVIGKIKDVLGFGGGEGEEATLPISAAAAEEAAADLEAAQIRIDGAINGINSKLATLDFSAATGTLESAGSDLASAFIKGFNGGGEATGILPTLQKLPADAAAALNPLLVSMAGFGLGAGTAFATSFKTPMDGAQTDLTAFTTNANVTFSDFDAAAAAHGLVAGENFRSSYAPKLAEALTSTSLFRSFASTELQGFAGDAGTAGSQAGTQFSSNWSRGLSTAESATNTAISRMISAVDRLQSAASRAFSYGAAISQGVASGIDSNLGAVEAAAGRIVAAVDKAITAQAQIASPSRLTAEHGRDMVRGLIMGVDDLLPDLSRSLDGLFRPDAFDTAAMMASLPLAGGNTTIINNVTVLAVKSSEWVGMVRQAENNAQWIEGLEHATNGLR